MTTAIAYLIDPYADLVASTMDPDVLDIVIRVRPIKVSVDKDGQISGKEIIRMIGGPVHNPDLFECVRIADLLDLWIDESGLLAPAVMAWETARYPNPLVGRALILGNDAMGGSIAPDITQEALEKLLDLRVKGFYGHSDQDIQNLINSVTENAAAILNSIKDKS